MNETYTMATIKNKSIKKTERKNSFAITPTFTPIILIAIAIGVFYFLKSHDFFPLWINKIYFLLKIFIAFEIIIGSSKTVIMPLITLIVAIALIVSSQIYNINLISMMDSWQLLFAAILGFLVSLIVKF